MKELYDIWFSSLDINNKTKLDLLNKYTTKEIWNLEISNFVENEILEKDILEILNSKNLEDSKTKLNYMKQKNIKLISIKDKNYPQKLHNIEDEPAFLYVRGDENVLDDDSVRNCRL